MNKRLIIFSCLIGVFFALYLFNDYRREANALMKQYESKYGPLNVKSDSLEKGPFAWVNNMWPWEDRFYV